MDDLPDLEPVNNVEECGRYANLYVFCGQVFCGQAQPYMEALNLLDLDAVEAEQDKPLESLCAEVCDYYYKFQERTKGYSNERWKGIQEKQNEADLSPIHRDSSPPTKLSGVPVTTQPTRRLPPGALEQAKAILGNAYAFWSSQTDSEQLRV